MGSRPSSFKSGGGFLNGVTSTLVDLVFSDHWSDDAPDGKFYLVPSFLVDGGDEAVTQHLFAGSSDFVAISEDGKSLIEGELWAKSPAALFIRTFVEGGFPETSLPEDGEPVTYQAMVGSRVITEQEVDEKATKELGKRKDKKDPSKSYNRTNLVVKRVVALPGTPVQAATTRATSKPNGKAGTPTPAPVRKVATAKKTTAPAVDIDALTAETLVSILGDTEGNTIDKVKLNLAVTRKLNGNASRDTVRKRIQEDDFLNAQTEAGIVVYDPSTRMIALA